MILEIVFFGGFALAIGIANALALKSGKLIYGHIFSRQLYVERRRQPVIFWSLWIFYGVCAIWAVTYLALSAIHNY